MAVFLFLQAGPSGPPATAMPARSRYSVSGGRSIAGRGSKKPPFEAVFCGRIKE